MHKAEITHTGSTVYVEDSDDTNVAILLRGLDPQGAPVEALLIYTRTPDDVDRHFGHDRIYFNYNTVGTHGLVAAIDISVGHDVTIRLTEDALALGIPALSFVFECVGNFDAQTLQHFSTLCSVTRTSFAYEIPIRPR